LRFSSWVKIYWIFVDKSALRRYSHTLSEIVSLWIVKLHKMQERREAITYNENDKPYFGFRFSNLVRNLVKVEV
jgi:hypothetical protein